MNNLTLCSLHRPDLPWTWQFHFHWVERNWGSPKIGSSTWFFWTWPFPELNQSSSSGHGKFGQRVQTAAADSLSSALLHRHPSFLSPDCYIDLSRSPFCPVHCQLWLTKTYPSPKHHPAHDIPETMTDHIHCLSVLVEQGCTQLCPWNYGEPKSWTEWDDVLIIESMELFLQIRIQKNSIIMFFCTFS